MRRITSSEAEFLHGIAKNRIPATSIVRLPYFPKTKTPPRKASGRRRYDLSASTKQNLTNTSPADAPICYVSLSSHPSPTSSLFSERIDTRGKKDDDDAASNRIMEGSDNSSEFRGKRTHRARRRRLQGLISDGFITETKSKLQRALNNSPSDPHSSASSAESCDSPRIQENSDGGRSGGEGSSGGRKGGLVYGHVAMMGRRRAMEDAVTVAPPGWLAGKYSFFAVYDGHGGAEVAEKCREKMHNCLEKLIEKASKTSEEKGFDWEKVMEDCFCNMDVELEKKERSGNEAAADEAERMMGSTAMVVLVGKEEVVVANCGTLGRCSASPQPDRDDEKERIEAAGGKILNWNGWRVQGVLATSRSLGDRYLKPYVSCKPEVTVVRRSESDDFLIIATDGLFDVVSNETACEVVKKCLSGQIRRGASEETSASKAAATLAELAIAKGSRDNISVIVVQLK
ncbi:putative protein phosphatase 2C 8 [Sesamum alatum]|uniref:protein-serine/threonine phosphatase n=1 Tax=Sesamum alatum TaxID=300844 RepID=A0AAE1YSY1_9LAMI|nr:putative protein phosphatase 2C 8 [Sesamum alatum]